MMKFNLPLIGQYVFYLQYLKYLKELYLKLYKFFLDNKLPMTITKDSSLFWDNSNHMGKPILHGNFAVLLHKVCSN